MTLSGKVRQMAEIHREAELSREAVVPFPGTSHNQWMPRLNRPGDLFLALRFGRRL